MAKQKQVVVEEEGGVIDEGLEIISIGSLYCGIWEKKYWSSSRGKDRYPYPVGYIAVRAYNGSTCRVEICDGPKGPLFTITSADGHSCSGETPDMAWEKFQKKHYTRMKSWHGKRLSCRIDGVEFFGFKNSYVQRLLRELVADVNGSVEKSLSSSHFCNEISSTKQDNQRPVEKPKVTKKRSRKSESTNTKQVDRSGSKRSRPQKLISNTEASNSLHEKQTNCEHVNSVALSVAGKENKCHDNQGSVQASLGLDCNTAEEKDCNMPKDGLDLDFDIAESKLAGPEISKSIKMVDYTAEVGKPHDRSENLSSFCATTDEATVAQVSKASSGIEDVRLYAPDSLELGQVKISFSSPGIQGDSTYNSKEDSATKNIDISEEVTDIQIEEEIGTCTSNPSQQTELDPLGEEITKAMMTVLLPRAIPLLNKVSRKKKVTAIRSSKTSYCEVDLKEEKIETSLSVGAPLPAGVEVQKTNEERGGVMQSQNINLNTVVPSSEHSKFIVPDSYEDDFCGDDHTKHVILSSHMLEADQSGCEKDAYHSNSKKEVLLDMRNEPSVQPVNIDKGGHSLCLDEVCMTSNINLQEDKACTSEFTSSCNSSGNKLLSENLKDVCLKLDSVGVGANPLQRDLLALDCSSEDGKGDTQRGMSSVQKLCMDVPAKTAACKTFSSTQEPNKVYTRKRVPKPIPSAEGFKGPLSESIICRNVGDNIVPTTDSVTEPTVASKTSQMRSGVEGESHDFPVIHHKSTGVCAPGCKDSCNVSDPCILQMENSEICSNKEPVVQTNLTVCNDAVSSQKQKVQNCECIPCDAKNLNITSDCILQKQIEVENELEGTAELLGCYIHPLPISSVKLRMVANEIYICASCGHSIDEKRTLFVYKLGVQEASVGRPLFVGHSLVTFPCSKDDLGRDIALESSCLQFCPDGQSLVLLDSMRTPYCREATVDCLCSICTSNHVEENALKIVQIKPGYVSLAAKLKATDSLHCILVCEPNHLVAVGGSGKLYLWEMNSTWSASVTQTVIPVNELIYPSIVELKRIIKCASLVVGHNGFGEFGVWDISRRLFLSRFSAPGTSIYQFSPISIFRWERHGSTFTDADLINEIMDATKLSFLEQNENNSFFSSRGEDNAIWLLVQTESDAEHDYISSCFQTSKLGLWRLALLVNNTVIMGSSLDPRTAAINASAGHGIIGTHDGLVYLWELSTGNKLGTLHDFKGGSISCIATEESARAAVIGVADDGGKLLVYSHINK